MQHTHAQLSSEKQLPTGWILFGLLLFGVALRIWAVGWGLPYVDHPDEPAILNISLRMLSSGDANPHWFLYPSLFFYLLALVVGLVHQFGQLGSWHATYIALDQMRITTDLYTTVPQFFIAGRLLVSSLGSLSILVAALTTGRAWTKLAGLFAAAYIASSPYHVMHSQRLTTDVPVAFFTLLTFMVTLQVLKDGQLSVYLLAGLLAGLAASTKYNSGVIALAIIAAHILHWRARLLHELPRLIGAGISAIGGFILGTPYALLAWPDFLRGLRTQLAHYSAAQHGDLLGAWNIVGYIDFFWNDGLRPAPALALLLGIIVLLRYQPPVLLLWLSFALPFLLIHLAQPMHFMRNLLPLLVLCALPIGVAAATVVEWLSRAWAQLYVLAALAMAVLLFGATTQSAIEWTRFIASPGSKKMAEAFVRQLPHGSRIAVELLPAAWVGDPLVQPVSKLTNRPIDWYKQHGYRYLLVNSDNHRDDVAEYQALLNSAKTIQVFPGDRAGQPGPRIDVLEIDIKPEDLAIVPYSVQFGEQLKLLGYEMQPGPPRSALLPLESASAGIFPQNLGLQLNLTWQVMKQLDQNMALFVHITDAHGNVVARRDALMRYPDYPTSQWKVGEIVVDMADMPLPALTPGMYSINVGVYDLDTFEKLAIREPGDGVELGENGNALLLSEFEVR